MGAGSSENKNGQTDEEIDLSSFVTRPRLPHHPHRILFTQQTPPRRGRCGFAFARGSTRPAWLATVNAKPRSKAPGFVVTPSGDFSNHLLEDLKRLTKIMDLKSAC